jgi:hypothetical protein
MDSVKLIGNLLAMSKSEVVMLTVNEQFEGLRQLAELVGKSECNCLIRPAGSDVAFLYAAHTENASQVVCASGGGRYDIWTRDGLQRSDLSIDDAAKVVVAEYHLAKAARIKARYPSMDIGIILKTLSDGYQK